MKLKYILVTLLMIISLLMPIYAQAYITYPEEVNPSDVEVLAKLLWGECRGVEDKAQQAAVVWCVLNRVDSDDPYYPDTIIEVVQQPYQFTGYNVSYPVTEELYALAEDVLIRWYEEKAGEEDVGRVLPIEYLWFTGNGIVNIFTNNWIGGKEWDWSLSSPYIEET